MVPVLDGDRHPHDVVRCIVRVGVADGVTAGLCDRELEVREHLLRNLNPSRDPDQGHSRQQEILGSARETTV